MKIKIITILALLSCGLLPESWAQMPERRLLLVASEQHNPGSFSNSELRKVFLGMPVTRNDIRIKPLLNTTDPLAMSVFLQQVMFMSERAYRRQLISRVFRLGDQRPPEYEDIQLLAGALRSTPGSVTFMWSEQFEAHPGLVSLGVIWASSND